MAQHAAPDRVRNVAIPAVAVEDLPDLPLDAVAPWTLRADVEVVPSAGAADDYYLACLAWFAGIAAPEWADHAPRPVLPTEQKFRDELRGRLRDLILLAGIGSSEAGDDDAPASMPDPGFKERLRGSLWDVVRSDDELE